MSDTDDPKSTEPIADALPARSGGRRPWMLLIGLALLAVVLVYVYRDLRANFRQIKWHEVHINGVFVALSMLSLLGARLMNALNCPTLLSALGSRVSARRVAPIIWLASLGRYMPGKMAVVAGSVVMIVRLGVRLPIAVASLFLSMCLMMLIGLMTATPLLLTPDLRQKFPAGPRLTGIMLAIGLVCLFPPIFLRLCNALLRLIKRQPLPSRMNLRPFVGAVGLTMLRSLLLGMGLWLAARALSPIPISSYLLALGSAGLASVIGFLAFFAPAGVGVHEEIYMLTMAPLLGPQVALLVVLFRVFHVVADLIMAAIGTAMIRFDNGSAAAPAPAPCPAG